MHLQHRSLVREVECLTPRQRSPPIGLRLGRQAPPPLSSTGPRSRTFLTTYSVTALTTHTAAIVSTCPCARRRNFVRMRTHETLPVLTHSPRATSLFAAVAYPPYSGSECMQNPRRSCIDRVKYPVVDTARVYLRKYARRTLRLRFCTSVRRVPHVSPMRCVCVLHLTGCDTTQGSFSFSLMEGRPCQAVFFKPRSLKAGQTTSAATTRRIIPSRCQRSPLMRCSAKGLSAAQCF